MKKNILIIILVISYAVYCAYAQPQKETQGEFIVKLVKSMGLDIDLTGTSPIEDYIDKLEAKGIKPKGGFKPDEIITEEEKTRLTTEAFKLLAPSISHEAKGQLRRNKAVIAQIEGDVKIKFKDKDKWIKAETGMQLSENDYIRTGAKSSVDLNVGVSGRVRIMENTELLLKNLSMEALGKRENICLYLSIGEMLVDANKVGEETNFTTTTPTTVIAVRGTSYKVKVQ